MAITTACYPEVGIIISTNPSVVVVLSRRPMVGLRQRHSTHSPVRTQTGRLDTHCRNSQGHNPAPKRASQEEREERVPPIAPGCLGAGSIQAISQQRRTHLYPREEPTERTERNAYNQVPPTAHGSDREHESSKGTCHECCSSQEHECLKNSFKL